MAGNKLRVTLQNRPARPASPMVRSFASLPSMDQLHKKGKSLRGRCPRQSHAVWKVPRNRPDPISLLEKSSRGRIPHLVPIRYGRMMRSPFTFYRGAALNMAQDLASTPVTGLHVQACGDCHLLNFGFFATPERREIFDINDLDETLPAPWEWDVKRVGRQLRSRRSQQRFQRTVRAGHRRVLRSIVSTTHGGIQLDASSGRVVCAHRHRRLN
jgi:hypothetical protein